MLPCSRTHFTPVCTSLLFSEWKIGEGVEGVGGWKAKKGGVVMMQTLHSSLHNSSGTTVIVHARGARMGGGGYGCAANTALCSA